MMRINKIPNLIIAAILLLGFAFPLAAVHGATPPTFQTCDIFTGVGGSSGTDINWYRPDKCGVPTSETFIKTLTDPTNPGGGEMTGMGFDLTSCALGAGSPCLYATEFDVPNVAIFDNAGTFLGHCNPGGRAYTAHVESVAVDRVSGIPSIYFGQATPGTPTVIQMDPGCTTILHTYSPATEARGTDWIDLAKDASDAGLTDIVYTSEGVHVLVFDTATLGQESNVVIPLAQTGSALTPDVSGTAISSLPGAAAYALRVLSDGSVAVADTQTVVHVGSAGTLLGSCDGGSAGSGGLFGFNLLPDQSTFATGSFNNGQVDYMTIAHCDANQATPDFHFNAFQPGQSGFLLGVGIFGEVSQGCGQRCVSAPEFGAPALVVVAVCVLAVSLLIRSKSLLPTKF
jgi:hypothetical protein